MSLVHGPLISTSGLVWCIDAENTKSYPGSGTTVYDITSKQPSTSMSGGPTYTRGLPSYWTFDGVDDYIGGSSLTTSLSGGTAEIWTYINAINRNQGFLALNSGVGYINFWMPSSNTMRWEVIGTTGSAYSTINATTVSTTGVWYHFLGTFDGSTTKIYVNGNLETSQNMTNQPTGSYTAPIQVGRYDATYPASARISVARFYNRALSATEVLQNFNAARGRYGI
jgi:hypothetical protein